MRKLFTVATFFALLAGCNTLEGVGKDIKKGGAAIEKTAEKAKS